MDKRKRSKSWIIILILLVICFCPVLIEQQRLLSAKNKEMEKIQQDIAKVNKKNEELEKQKKILNTDKYAEKIAREKLGMVKPGDKVFVDIN